MTATAKKGKGKGPALNPRKDGKRWSGKPTRREKREKNKSAYAKSKKDFALYMPPVARARYMAIVEAVGDTSINTEAERQELTLELITGGLSRRWATEIIGITIKTWNKWLLDDEFKKRWHVAKEERTEAWADDIMDDAESANAFNVQAVRLRIETKKWLMGKQSGRYADKVVLAGDKDNPIHTINDSATPAEAQRAYRQMMGLGE